jgi:hypothetical protein
MTEQTVVKAAGTVDITKTAAEPVAVVNVEDMSVAQYAEKIAAEARGETYVPPAAAATTKDTAAAQDEKTAAAATDETVVVDKTKVDASATADEDEDEHPEQALEETHKARKGIEKKFSKLTSARDKALAEAVTKAAEAAESKKVADAATAEVARLKAEAEALAAKAIVIPDVPKIEDDPAPSREAFDDPDKYEQEVIAHTSRQEIRKANQRAEAAQEAQRKVVAEKAETDRKAKVQEQITTLHKTFNERVTAAKESIPDYDVKVTNNEKLILRNDVFFTIEQMEMPAHVLAHLADNPDEAASLNKMPPVTAAIRLGAIEAEIRIANKPKVTKAAPVTKPVGSRASPERKTPDEESIAEYDARLQREAAEKRKRDRNPRILN